MSSTTHSILTRIRAIAHNDGAAIDAEQANEVFNYLVELADEGLAVTTPPKHTQGVIVEARSDGTVDFTQFTSSKRITEARLKRFLTKDRGLEFDGDEVEDALHLVDADSLKPVDLDAAEAALKA